MFHFLLFKDYLAPLGFHVSFGIQKFASYTVVIQNAAFFFSDQSILWKKLNVFYK